LLVIALAVACSRASPAPPTPSAAHDLTGSLACGEKATDQGPDRTWVDVRTTTLRLAQGEIHARAVLSPVAGRSSSTVNVGAIQLLILRDAAVVGYDDVAFAGASIDVTVTAKRPWTRELSVAALGCPVDPTPGSASQRPPLPPGDYQVVAVLSNRASRVVGNARGVTL